MFLSTVPTRLGPLVLLCLSCVTAGPVVPREERVACPEPTVPPLLRAQLPEGFFLLDGPWPTLPRVALRPLDESKVSTQSVRSWKQTDLGFSSEGTFATAPAQVRGGLLANAQGDPPVYAFCRPPGLPGTVYFVSDGRGQNFLEGTTHRTLDGGVVQLDVAMLSPEIADRWMLTNSIHLAER